MSGDLKMCTEPECPICEGERREAAKTEAAVGLLSELLNLRGFIVAGLERRQLIAELDRLLEARFAVKVQP